MPHFESDIAPGANYMDRKRCFSIYFFTFSDCRGCGQYNHCKKQKGCKYWEKGHKIMNCRNCCEINKEYCKKFYE